ncbi:class B sortase [Lachnospiraceae bacterium OttesenSCG-928-D06]|nr:class B sortase [Lachnospiraceae bacterium OttesenSCG-928-D06]
MQKSFIIEGRQFRTQSDYNLALRDKKTIDSLRKTIDFNDSTKLKQLLLEIQKGKITFYTLLGTDFKEEIEEAIRKSEKKSVNVQKASKKEFNKKKSNKRVDKTKKVSSQKILPTVDDSYVQAELAKQERNRKLILILCSFLAVCCLGYFSVYSYYSYKTKKQNDELYALRNSSQSSFDMKNQTQSAPSDLVINYTTDAVEIPDVLDEYKNLYNKNKKLIGWIQIDDTNINYPVMQTSNNEYYLDHNLNQEYDKNGSIFMDKDGDVLKKSTNYILYGHNMKSGQMFGKLDLYESEKYYEEHKYIHFDTIYEKGLYEVMYVFRSQVYSEEDVRFKYYQFIDAYSELEFDSYMTEMAAMSFYDTGVTASFGDQLLTLSTCDYVENAGRFVVVAKRISE